MAVATVNYLQFRERATFNPAGPLWQNFFIDRATDFLPFGYGQGSGQVAGDRSEATLAVPVSQISLNFIHEASVNRYLVQILTKEVNVLTMREGAEISTEIFVIGSYSHDQIVLTVRLRGPGNATSQGPSRFLSEALVGSIPPSGTLVIG